MRGAVQLTNYRLKREDFQQTPQGMVARVTHHFHERWVGTKLYAAETGQTAHANIRCVDEATIEVTFPPVDFQFKYPGEDYILTVIA